MLRRGDLLPTFIDDEGSHLMEGAPLIGLDANYPSE